jgi:hypothetical protein
MNAIFHNRSTLYIALYKRKFRELVASRNKELDSLHLFRRLIQGWKIRRWASKEAERQAYEEMKNEFLEM